MFILSNLIRFDQQKYGRDAVVKESKVTFIEMPSLRSRRRLELASTELSLQDLPVNLDEITELTDSRVFKLNKSSTIY